MGINYTEEQKQVIHLRDRNLLVSAAAGSGKTAVLVERIIARITRDEHPISVDQLLIVTYTEAAASEMKERIHAAIEKALRENPENQHLREQATLIHQAQINTIHKFCLNVLRDYFHVIDLDPGYRVIESGEATLLKQDTVKEVLEQAYLDATPEFVDFVESFAAGKDDQSLEDLILELASNANQYPNPQEWLDECIEKYDTEKYDYFSESVQEAQRYLKGVKSLIEAAKSICETDDGPDAYLKAINADFDMVERMLGCTTFANLQSEFHTLKWTGLGSKKPYMDPEKIDQVKEIRDYYKKMVGTIAGTYFFENESVLKADMLLAKKHVTIIVNLVKAYLKAFAKQKKSKNLIDFSDMEHFALQILTKKEGDQMVPSEIAENYQKKFAEVMIDEYQDINYVQETILSSVSGVSRGIYNRFMVGDVKQSIYQFRQSKPELFMKKQRTYSLNEGKEQRIDLHKNFRSRKEVLESCNFVFDQIMREDFGGIEYDDLAALHVGAEYEAQDGNETELLILDSQKATSAEQLVLESEMIAKRIHELMETQMVTDKENGGMRRLRYKDITIVCRSTAKYCDAMTKVFKQNHIPLYTGPKKGYFKTQEIELILSYLKALDNPMQDIHFTAVLTSTFGNFSTEELAMMRSGNKKTSMYESVRQYAENGSDEELKRRIQTFLQKFNRFRDKVSYMAIHEFLWLLLNETGYLDCESVKPGGEQRRANLEMLVEKAIAFESTSYKGLFNFVRYVEQLQSIENDSGEATVMDEQMDAVTLMTIHHSKGLEFPVVFVAGVGRQFNLQDGRKTVVTHSNFGIGINAIDSKIRMKTPTLLKKIIQQKIVDENIAEEIRVLYVAMTRAKEKLILTGTASGLEKQQWLLVALDNHSPKKLPYYMVAKARKYLDWLMAALYREQGVAPIRFIEMTMDELVLSEAKKMMHGHIKQKILTDWDTEKVYNDEIRTLLTEQFSFTYPYAECNVIKQKLSVSELKKRIHMEEEGYELFKEEEIIPLLPEYLQEKEELTGASRGTAYHKLMELLDFTLDYDESLLRTTIEEKCQAGYMDRQMAECIRVKDILQFLQSTAGIRMKRAAEKECCYSEQPFVLGLDAKQVYPDVTSEETVLIQGIIDVYFEEDGELVVLDYKTDNVTCAKELVERYHSQLDYYAEALEQLTGKHVKEKIIYSFKLQEVIEV